MGTKVELLPYASHAALRALTLTTIASLAGDHDLPVPVEVAMPWQQERSTDEVTLWVDRHAGVDGVDRWADLLGLDRVRDVVLDAGHGPYRCYSRSRWDHDSDDGVWMTWRFVEVKVYVAP